MSEEFVGVSEELFIARMNSLENIGVGILVASSLAVGALLALLVMRFFHVH